MKAQWEDVSFRSSKLALGTTAPMVLFVQEVEDGCKVSFAGKTNPIRFASKAEAQEQGVEFARGILKSALEAIGE